MATIAAIFLPLFFASLPFFPFFYWRVRKNRRAAATRALPPPLDGAADSQTAAPYAPPLRSVLCLANWRSSEIQSPIEADDCFALLSSTVHRCHGYRWAWWHPLQNGEIFYGWPRRQWFWRRRIIMVNSCTAFAGRGEVVVSILPAESGSKVRISLEWGTVVVCLATAPAMAFFITEVAAVSGLRMMLFILPAALTATLRMLVLLFASVRLKVATTSIVRVLVVPPHQPPGD